MNFLKLFSRDISRPTLIIAILLITMIAGCGKKGPVRPKVSKLPPTPSKVTLQQQGNLFLLGWNIPAADKDGSTIEDLSGFRIKRLTYAADDGCPTCREPQLEVAEIDLRYPEPAQQVGNRVYWRDLDIRPGNGYRYAIVPLTVGGYEGTAATIHLSVMQPPSPPGELTAKAGDSKITLQWAPPRLPEGTVLIGYNLYRRQAKRIYPLVPVNVKPLETTQIVDRGLDNARAYEYRVSSLVRVGEQTIESNASSSVLVTPQEGR